MQVKFTLKVFGILLYTFVVFGCNNQQDKQPNNANENAPITSNESKDVKLQQLEVEASRLRAGGSIKSVELVEGKAIVKYVKDYAEYKQIQPQSSLTQADLESYWETGDAIEKALIDGSVRIMKKLDYVNATEIVLPYKGNTYSISVSKSELEKFTGLDFSTLQTNWDDKFSNPFVYDDNGRKKFFQKFGKVN